MVDTARPPLGSRAARVAGRSPATRTPARACHPSGWRRPASRRDRLRPRPVAVAAETQQPQLLTRLADQLRLADVNLDGVPAQRLALGPIAPVTTAQRRAER